MTDEFQTAGRTVSNVQRLGPTPARGLDRLVGIHCDIRQGEPADDMRIDFDLSCGIAPLEIGKEDFELGLRACFVTLRRRNCDVRPGTAYEHWLDIGAFKESQVKTTTTARSRGGEFSLDAGVDAPRGVAALAAKLGLRIQGKRDAESRSVSEQSARVGLIVTSGQDRWRVGDLTHGDARKPDGVLGGDYFLEQRTNEGESRPLCKLTWVDQTTPVRLTVSVSASFGSLLIFRSGQPSAGPVPNEVRTSLKRRSQQAVAEHEELLRAHVAGLVAAKKLRAAQLKAGAEIANNEFTIVSQTLLAFLDNHELPSSPDLMA